LDSLLASNAALRSALLAAAWSFIAFMRCP
jgi:hypothetical protein